VNSVNDNDEKERYSLLLGITASGLKLPPLIVFRGANTERGTIIKELKSHPQIAQRNLYLTCNKTAWVTREILLEYLEFVFKEDDYFDLEDPKLIIMDNFGGHNVEEDLDENRFKILFLPENSTHLTQPLDILINRSLKSSLRKKFLRHLIENDCKKVSAKDARNLIIEKVLETWNEDISSQLIKKSFELAGITYPTLWTNKDRLNEPLKRILERQSLNILNQNDVDIQIDDAEMIIADDSEEEL